MASTFRMTTKASIGVTASPTTLYTAPSGTTVIVLGMALCNKSANQVTVKVLLESDTATSVNTGAGAANDNVELVHDVVLAAGNTLEIMEGQKIILQTTDVLKVSASAGSAVDVKFSYMEQT